MKTLLHYCPIADYFRRIAESESMEQTDRRSFPGKTITTLSLIAWLAVLLIMTLSTMVKA